MKRFNISLTETQRKEVKNMLNSDIEELEIEVFEEILPSGILRLVSNISGPDFLKGELAPIQNKRNRGL
jgi:hypothetical protein